MFQVGQKVDVTGMTIGKGYAGVIKRHHFSSNRASHGNSVSHNSPGSIGMAQDPGRVFPGKRMAGHLGNVTAHRPAPGESRASTPSARLVMIKGSVPGAKNGSVVLRHSVKAKARRGQVMELKVINDKGEALDPGGRLRGPVRPLITTRRWCTRSSWRTTPTAAQGTRAQKDRGRTLSHSTKKPWRQKGTGRARAGMTSSPLWRGGGTHLPELARRELHPEAEPQDVPRGHGIDPVAARPRGATVGRRRPHGGPAQDEAACREARRDGSRPKC